MIYAENILICIAVPFFVALLFLRGDVSRFTATFLLGMGLSMVAAYISGFLCLVTGLGENDTSVFISPLSEEILKFLPILFYLLIFRPDDRRLILLAVAMGAGFATFENCCYILTFGAESLPYIMIRGLAVGVMHIVSILILSIWLILIRRMNVMSFPAVFGGISLPMIFHSLYNLLVSGEGPARYVGFMLPILTAALLYNPYKKITSSME